MSASIHRHLKQYAESGVDFHAAIQLRPTDRRARQGLEPTVQGLVYAAWQEHQTGQRRMALDLLDLALAIAPRNRDALRRRSSIIEGGRGASDADLAQLQAEAREAPDDFRLVQQLDYVLARRRRYSEIIAMWEAYLKRRPDHARALLERSGAYYHIQRLDQAIADARRACALGLSEGCHHAARLEHQLVR